MSESTSITFEEGYRRLQEIAERVNSDEVPVHEMCDLFAEGKGLEQALGGYLAEQRTRVEAIERGEGIQAFRIEAPGAAAGDRARAADPDGAAAARAAGPAAAEPAAVEAAASAQPRLGDDEIPF